MTKVVKLRLLAILLYVAPILVFTMLTKTVTDFLLSAGVMTILLGLSLKFIPSYIGYKKEMNKDNSFIFVIVSGILLLILASM